LCDACSDESGGPSCIPGATCAVTLTCARYCCTDADCGPGGTCTTGAFTPASSVLGACTAD
jgi:hypothetical protein